MKVVLLLSGLLLGGTAFGETSIVQLVTQRGLVLTDCLPATRYVIVRHREEDALWHIGTNHCALTAGSEIEATFLNRTPTDRSCQGIRILGNRPLTDPPLETFDTLRSGKANNRLVRTEGVVHEVRKDDIDSTILFLALLDDHNDLTYCCGISEDIGGETLRSLVGSRIRVKGLCRTGLPRRFIGPIVFLTDRSAIAPAPSPSEDPFAVPKLDELAAANPVDLIRIGRHRTVGQVLAVQHRARIVHLRTRTDDLCRVGIPNGDLPGVGETIEAVGLPETDLFRLHLTHACFRKVPSDDLPTEHEPIDTTIPRLLRNPKGLNRIDPTFDGRLIRLSGTVLPLTSECADAGLIQIERDGDSVFVDISALPSSSADVREGCGIEITGICILDTDPWQPHLAFPRTRGLTVVLRAPDDLRILSRPSWWTAGRLTVAIGILMLAIVSILIWNRSLKVLADRRGRELFREQVGHVKADLRTEERTRLAVELHDTLAQNLTGVSMEIEAANDLRGNAPQPMLAHLGIAAKALKSCRDELRNCLWDLRSQALEEPDMTKAVLKTLQPVVNDSRLAVRFNVPRTRLSDNTAHALLRVVRELVVNAIRHGNASSVRVAGTIDRGKLLCSVTDDGRGFDPDTVPGVLQGHFGLQGIQERINEISGTFDITSAPGKGTKATISIPIPREY